MIENFANEFKTITSNPFNTAVTSVRKREWIVGSLSENGIFNFAAKPVFHSTDASAQAEATRLAKLNPGTSYIVVRLTAGKLVPRVLGVAEF